MSQPELLKAVTGWLDQADKPYFLTGSIASSLQGEPRSTHDIDLVVAMTVDDVSPLLECFPPPQFLVERAAAAEAIRRRQMFSLLDSRSGTKVDFWVVSDDPFNRSRFARRQRVEVDGFAIWVSSPEDTILSKLRWAKLSGGSEKQFRDAVRVYEVQGPALNEPYLDEWAAALGLASDLLRLRGEARPSKGLA